MPRSKGTKLPENPYPVSGWNRPENSLKGYDPELSKHLKAGGNYGYYPASGSSLLNIDIDDAEAFHKAGGADLVSGTFMYSAWPDRHKYRAVVTCSDMPEYWRGSKSGIKIRGSDKADIELFFPAGPVTEQEKGVDGIFRSVTVVKTGGQCVGPGSIHPDTGLPYAAFDEEAPILEITWKDLLEVTDKILPAALEEQAPKNIRIQGAWQEGPGRKLLRDRYHLSLEMPDDAYQTSSGEIRGSNPWHGSTSKGGNVAVNPRKGVMFCFRCCKGYDAAGVDAIRRGIIHCGDDYTAEVFRSHVAELERDFPEIRVKEIAVWKARKQAEEAKKPKITLNKIMNQGGTQWKK